MTFDEVVAQVRELLQSKGRVAYRALKRRFDLDDEYLEDVKAELIKADRVARDEDEEVLVWVGQGINGETEKGRSGEAGQRHTAPEADSQTDRLRDSRLGDRPPVSYTPSHLAERIRAVTVNAGERKTITALFADLKGSTALIEGLDPEEAQRIIDPALQLMMDAVHQYEGFVAQPLGDGIFALFGAPLAHEDHPQRALYAALRMQETMRRYADTLRQKGYPPLLMRVGLNTGEVVLRSIRKDDLRADYVPVGHSTNLAARMEQLATPGSIVASAYTHRLTDGYFAFKDLGPTRIKGVEEPLHIYEVLGVGQFRTRLQVSARRSLTRFVGRHSEMEQLNKALAQAKAGQGQIVGTMGEPGLGKSRLFHEFKLLSLTGCLVLEAYSVSHGKATAYLPMIELLKSYFEIKSEDDERKRREKVTGKVLTLDRSLEDTLPYLFALLGIEEQPSPLAQMDPQIRRRRTFEALKKLFLRESLNQPLVLIFEDLHWIDGETQGFLDVLSESLASAKLLLLTNYRPEYRHEWGQKTYYTQLRLAPFGKAEAEEFLDVLLGESPRPIGEKDRVRGIENNLSPLKHLILDKTQGTPFFMEEIVQELIEQGVLVRTAVGVDLRVDPQGLGAHPSTTLRTGSGAPLQIPPTVQGILAARIDRLAPDEKALLQQLAVVGRQFPLSLIRQVITQPEADLYRLLASLQHKEFLYEQPAFPESEYLFKHALTQDVAYSSVLQEQKKLLHERTGQAIERLYKDKIEEHYGELAHHYQRSGNIEKAIEYLHLAGQQAVQRSANTEAITYLTAALDLLTRLAETPEHQRQELTLRLTLGGPLMAIRGYAAGEVEQTYSRASELCEQLGETASLFTALWGLWMSHMTRGNLPTARVLGEKLLTLTQNEHDSALLLEAHRALGAALVNIGEFLPAREHLEKAFALYDRHQHSPLLFRYGQDLGVSCLIQIARALWYLGYPEQARRRIEEALRLAHELAHPFTLALTLIFANWLYQFRREQHVVQEQVEALLTLSAEQQFPIGIAFGALFRGWALAEYGQIEAGFAQTRQGLAAMQAGNMRLGQPYGFALLAEMCAERGQPEEGFLALDEALTTMERNGERSYEAELHRIKGELTLQSKASLGQVSSKSQASLGQVQDKFQTSQSPSEVETEAEACFLKAIEVAQKQQAKSFELRATMSLARLWQHQGKSAEAYELLAPVYNWFTEGFDTKDLQEAQALIAELSH
jgi:class 3 adenylate cyclase/predicted ATPase